MVLKVYRFQKRAFLTDVNTEALWHCQNKSKQNGIPKILF